MEFHLIRNGKQEGPFTVEELGQQGITPESEVWAQGMADWMQAGDVPELTAVLQRAEFEAAQQASRAAENQAVSGQPYNPPQYGQQPPRTTHQVPPQGPPQQPVKKSGCTPWLLAGLILAVLFGTMVFTCPDRKAHEDAIQEVTKQWLEEKVQDKVNAITGTEGFGSVVGDIFGKFVAELTDKSTDIAVTQYLDVKNYMVCSVGTISIGDSKDNMVSLGIFGHVFTFDKEDLEKLWAKAWDDYEAKNKIFPSSPSKSGVPGQEEEEIVVPDVLPDSILGVEVPEEMDTLLNQMKDEAIRMAKEWAKQQIDELGN
ncbi:MAG: DUF4339 domain-containing protein [Muribaculaceae bacterium]|jgi:hypothetical protein|nr:DUF4339 domain-containing protein [Muribaculaceae bacterium]